MLIGPLSTSLGNRWLLSRSNGNEFTAMAVDKYLKLLEHLLFPTYISTLPLFKMFLHKVQTLNPIDFAQNSCFSRGTGFVKLSTIIKSVLTYLTTVITKMDILSADMLMNIHMLCSVMERVIFT